MIKLLYIIQIIITSWIFQIYLNKHFDIINHCWYLVYTSYYIAQIIECVYDTNNDNNNKYQNQISINNDKLIFKLMASILLIYICATTINNEQLTGNFISLIIPYGIDICLF